MLEIIEAKLQFEFGSVHTLSPLKVHPPSQCASIASTDRGSPRSASCRKSILNLPVAGHALVGAGEGNPGAKPSKTDHVLKTPLSTPESFSLLYQLLNFLLLPCPYNPCPVRLCWKPSPSPSGNQGESNPTCPRKMALSTAELNTTLWSV